MSGFHLRLPFFSPHLGHLIHKRKDLDDIVGMSAHYLDGHRDALGINQNVDLRALLAAIRGIRPGFLATAGRLRRRAVDPRARPVDLAPTVDLSPRAAPQLSRHLAPWDAGPKHEDNAGQDLAFLNVLAVRITVPSSTRRGSRGWTRSADRRGPTVKPCLAFIPPCMPAVSTICCNATSA